MSTIETKRNDKGEWVSSGRISERTEETSPEKREAITEILEPFFPPFDPLMSSIYYPELRDKYIKAEILDREEIDEIVKPYAIANLKAVLKSETFDVFISTTNKWVKMGVLNEDDKIELFTLEQVRNIALKHIKQLIDSAWRRRKYVEYPKEYTSLLDSYVFEGVVTSEETQKLWEEPLRGSS